MKKQILDRGVKARSSRLKGLQVAFAVTGGIASVETVKIIRELRRRGAEVTVFMTPSAARFITPLSLEWASTRSVIMEESADVECLEKYDLLIVAPATLNSIAKSALGLADNVVSLLVATQFGLGSRILFVPTMHSSMLQHPLYGEYCQRLKNWGAEFLENAEEEGRMKIPSPIVIADYAEKMARSKK